MRAKPIAVLLTAGCTLVFGELYGTNVVINSFDGNGKVTFAYPAGTTNLYWVEWASALTAEWMTSWHSLERIAPTNNPCTVHVPMFYRVVCNTNRSLRPVRIVSGIKTVDLPNDTPIGTKDVASTVSVGDVLTLSVGIQNASIYPRTLLAPEEIRVCLVLETADRSQVNPIHEFGVVKEEDSVLTTQYAPWETKWRQATIRVPYVPTGEAYVFCFVPRTDNLDRPWSSGKIAVTINP